MRKRSASASFDGGPFGDAGDFDTDGRTDAQERRVRKGFWSTLRRAAGHLPFAEELVAAYFCALDRRTPTRVRAMLLSALAYFVLPVDVVPDILAGVGFTDDVTVLLGTLALVRAHIGDDHRRAARRALENAG